MFCNFYEGMYFQVKNKTVCFLYRTKTLFDTDQPDMERQRNACLQFAEEHGWIPIRESWAKEDDEDESNNHNEPLIELRAGAETKKFDILLISEFDRLGCIPQESIYATIFFEQHGIEVWEASGGHIGAYVRKWKL